MRAQLSSFFVSTAVPLDFYVNRAAVVVGLWTHLMNIGAAAGKYRLEAGHKKSAVKADVVFIHGC